MDERTRTVHKASTHVVSCVAMDVAARHNHSAAMDADAATSVAVAAIGCVVADGARVERDSATIDVNATALRAEDIRCQFNGAMDERARTVHMASTHSVCCVAANGASVKGDGGVIDVDAAALHPEKKKSIQRGDG